MRFRRTITFLLALLLAAALCVPCAFAEEDAASSPVSDARFDNKSWEEITSDFLSSLSVDGASVGIGYVNLVTGEEEYWNADQYMVSGSMYKVPLNMYFSRLVAQGVITEDTLIGGAKYSYIRHETIVNSNNSLPSLLWDYMDRNNDVHYRTVYQTYRHLIAELMGEDHETVADKFYENNFFTPRQMIYCLSLLYNNSEEFPGVIEEMLKAEQKKYFCLKEDRFPIAHKYGYLAEADSNHFYLDDCAIVYTTDPFALVVFTDNAKSPYTILSDYMILMCDYTEYTHALRLEEEARAAEEAARLEQEALQQQAEEALQQTIAAQRTDPGEEAAAASAALQSGDASSVPVLSPAALRVCIGIGVLFLASVILILLRRRMLRFFPALLSALFAAAALLVCTVGVSCGTLVFRTEGDPTAPVEGFFTALEQGEDTLACSYLSNCSSLGLDRSSDNEATALLSAALRESYSHELYGEPAVNRLEADQVVIFTYLDLSLVDAAVQQKTPAALEAVVAQYSSASDIYDSEQNYLPAITDAAYLNALTEVLSQAETYYVSRVFTLHVTNSANTWRLEIPATLLTALAGGLSY